MSLVFACCEVRHGQLVAAAWNRYLDIPCCWNIQRFPPPLLLKWSLHAFDTSPLGYLVVWVCVTLTYITHSAWHQQGEKTIIINVVQVRRNTSHASGISRSSSPLVSDLVSESSHFHDGLPISIKLALQRNITEIILSHYKPLGHLSHLATCSQSGQSEASGGPHHGKTGHAPPVSKPTAGSSPTCAAFRRPGTNQSPAPAHLGSAGFQQ